tara:strand:+ start:9976 stop:10713 length:738 start_codon:yes stop_codon:yes gene_type:complete
MVDAILNAIADIESILDNEKGNMAGGVHLQLCTAVLKAFKETKGFQKAHFGSDENDNSDDDYDDYGEEEEGEEESNSEPERERTEDDMELNELSELWGWNFDFGRPTAVLPLEGLIETIVEDFETKRVCAAVRVLNRAVKGSKPDDPADAERILQWKEELVEQRAIEECARILEGDREFQNSDDDPWMYSVLCDEILELFQRLGEGDALFRTKLRRNGALKGVKDYYARGLGHATEGVLEMLRQP